MKEFKTEGGITAVIAQRNLITTINRKRQEISSKLSLSTFQESQKEWSSFLKESVFPVLCKEVKEELREPSFQFSVLAIDAVERDEECLDTLGDFGFLYKKESESRDEAELAAYFEQFLGLLNLKLISVLENYRYESADPLIIDVDEPFSEDVLREDYDFLFSSEHDEALAGQPSKKSFFKRLNYLKEIAEYTKKIELEPDNAEHFYNRGVAKCREDYEGAIEDFIQASRLTDDEARYFRECSMADFFNGRYEAALENIAIAIEIDPETALHFAMRGEIKFKLDDIKGAYENFKEAIRLSPDTSYFYDMCGKIELRLKQYEN